MKLPYLRPVHPLALILVALALLGLIMIGFCLIFIDAILYKEQILWTMKACVFTWGAGLFADLILEPST